MLKLNSIANDVFAAKGIDSTVVYNEHKISRNDIVSTGRLLACEYSGRKLNERKGSLEKYNSRLNGTDYATLEKAHREKKMLFCAAQAYKSAGIEEMPDLATVKNNASLARDPVYLKTMSAIDRDVIEPLMFKVFDDVAANGLLQWEASPLGATKEIEVRSNDAIVFEDSAWGSSRSTTKNYLYKQSITANMTPHSANLTLKWYQDIVNGDAGRYYAALMNGMWSKIYASFISALTSSAQNQAYVPAALTAATYSTAGFLALTTRLAALNGVSRGDLVAFGEATALSQLLPVDGNGGAITGLQYGLGEEWFKNGYLQRAGQVDVVEITPAIVPTTQNSLIGTVGTGTDIYIAAKAGKGYAPVFGVYAEGSPIILTADATETADFTVDINVTAIFDIIPVFASRVAVISSVYGS